ncbi:MAG: hypothetical protein ACQEXN_15860 [Actinomycetota bacterium]
MSARKTEAQGLPNWWEETKQEAIVYMDHVLGLLPGRNVHYFAVDQGKPGDMAGWDATDKILLIEQGRIQLERQRQDLENIRQRAQFLFTTTLGTIGLVSLGFPQLATHSGALILWFLGVTVLVMAMLGAAGVVVAKKLLREIHTSLLSMQASPLYDALAIAYAGSISQGENTVATQITVFRDAVFCLIVGLLLVGASWVVQM